MKIPLGKPYINTDLALEKIKEEVVPMDLKISNRIKKKNTHIAPIKWNKLIKKKKTLLLDVTVM